MIPSRNRRLLSFLLALIYFALIIAAVFSVIEAYNTRESTGILEVTTSDTRSAITISSANKQAALLGVGSAKARLQPGDYFVMAQAKGLWATQMVTITLHRTTKISLKLGSAPVLPSPSSISFVNMSALLDDGISAVQISNIEQLFFTYKQSAKIITINVASIEQGPRDPNSTSLWSSLTFSGEIDGSNFTATLRYSGLETTQLTLNDPVTGAVVFSGQLPPVPTS